MRKIIIGTIVLFTGVLIACWVLAERARPAFINVDPAALRRR